MRGERETTGRDARKRERKRERDVERMLKMRLKLIANWRAKTTTAMARRSQRLLRLPLGFDFARDEFASLRLASWRLTCPLYAEFTDFARFAGLNVWISPP